MFSEDIDAFYISIALIDVTFRAPENETKRYADTELRSAGKTLKQLIGKCEKLPEKFRIGSPQHTLAIRRLRAFHKKRVMQGGFEHVSHGI